MDEIENPVIPPDSEEARILAEMEAFDKEPVNVDLGPAYAATKAAQEKEMAARAKAEAQEKAEQPEKAEEKVEKAEEEPKAETDERPRDEKGRFVPKADTGDEQPPVEKAGEDVPVGDKAVQPDQVSGKPDTAYEKAKKEAARKEKTWQQLEKEKAEVRAEAARLKAERDTFEKVMTQRSQPQVRPRDEHGEEIYTSQEYRDAAKQFRRDGEHEMADKAEYAAEVALKNETKAAQQRFQEHQRDMAFKVMDAEPELNNEESPLAQAVKSVFEEEAQRARQYQRPSIFHQTLDGFGLAVEVAKLRMKATAADTLAKELKEARAEIQRLNSLTSVSASGPTRPGRAKSFEEMTSDEQLEYMDKQARAAGQNFFVPNR